MSKKVITKEVEAVVCDFCNKEVDTKSSEYCYHHIRNNTVINKKWVTWYLFSWYRPSNSTSISDKYVRYDFHASCFDTLMQKFLEETK